MNCRKTTMKGHWVGPGVSQAVLLITIVAAISFVKGNPSNCTYASVGKPRHYFDNYTEVTYNASCGRLCQLPVFQDPLQVTELKVFFQHNHSQADCSWVLPGFQNNTLSIVMFFEPSTRTSLVHNVRCGQSTPSLTLWDQYSLDGLVQTTYNVCRKAGEDKPEDYSRRSSRLGRHDTLITLSSYDFQPMVYPTLLKYITVDWSQDCFQQYKEIEVGPSENMTTLGSQWFTRDLRLPNGMQCKWKFSSPSSGSDMIRLRVTVLKMTAIPGSCAQDDYVQVKDNTQDKIFTLCDDSGPFFFSSFSSSVLVDFNSGDTTGAPEFEMSYSTLNPCPSERLVLEADLVENVVYGVSDSQLSSSTCMWKLNTNWTNNVIMLTRLDRQQFQQDCTDEDYLEVDLGKTVRRISLCEDPPLPLWSYGRHVNVDLHHRPRSSRRTVGVFYKSVPKIEYCQGHPGLLEATSSRENSILVDSYWHRTHRPVSAPDCRWLIRPSPQMAKTDRYVAKLLVSNSGAASDFWESNITTARWMISGFRAYSGETVNASASLSSNCYYLKNALQCDFISQTDTLLLLYDPSLSTAPRPLDKVNLAFQQVLRKVSSGQTGSHVRSWHAHVLPLLMAVVLRRFLC